MQWATRRDVSTCEMPSLVTQPPDCFDGDCDVSALNKNDEKQSTCGVFTGVTLTKCNGCVENASSTGCPELMESKSPTESMLNRIERVRTKIADCISNSVEKPTCKAQALDDERLRARLSGDTTFQEDMFEQNFDYNYQNKKRTSDPCAEIPSGTAKDLCVKCRKMPTMLKMLSACPWKTRLPIRSRLQIVSRSK